MRRYVMTRSGETAVVVVVEASDEEGVHDEWQSLEHLVHKSDVLDWTRSSGPGAGNAPSDLARSIVGDLLGRSFPAPNLYRELTLQLARIPYEGGELTEDEVSELIDEGLLP